MTDYFAFYGTLRRAANDPNAPGLAGLVSYQRDCQLAGVLHSHGPYPGFFPAKDSGEAQAEDNPAIVKAELFKVESPEAFAVFDEWEDYDPENEAASLYLRRKIRLLAPDVEAWVYLSQLAQDGPIVPDGDWLAYVETR